MLYLGGQSPRSISRTNRNAKALRHPKPDSGPVTIADGDYFVTFLDLRVITHNDSNECSGEVGMGCEGFCNKPGVPVDADFRLAAGCPRIAPLLLTSSILPGPDIFFGQSDSNS
jgi:hypothetical protein